MKSDLSVIETTLSDLDRKVKNKEISDYEVYFSTWTLWFYYYENIFDLKK